MLLRVKENIGPISGIALGIVLIVVITIIMIKNKPGKGSGKGNGQYNYPEPEPGSTTPEQQAAASTDSDEVKSFTLGIYGAIEAFGYNGLNKYLDDILLMDYDILIQVINHWNNYYSQRFWIAQSLSTAIGMESCRLTQLDCNLQSAAIERIAYAEKYL